MLLCTQRVLRNGDIPSFAKLFFYKHLSHFLQGYPYVFQDNARPAQKKLRQGWGALKSGFIFRNGINWTKQHAQCSRILFGWLLLIFLRFYENAFSLAAVFFFSGGIGRLVTCGRDKPPGTTAIPRSRLRQTNRADGHHASRVGTEKLFDTASRQEELWFTDPWAKGENVPPPLRDDAELAWRPIEPRSINEIILDEMCPHENDG